MRVLVTGGAGFIGANLCQQLLADGVHDVVVLDDLSSGYLANLDGLAVKLVEGSILDGATLSAAVDGVDAVVHLAARPSVPRSIADPVASHEANATGTLRVLEAARGVGAHVTVASSSSVYGQNPVLPKHEDLAVMPVSPYAVSKLATESYALAYAACFGMRTIAFRFFNVFGPLQAAGHAYAAVVPAFVDAALDERPVTVHGDGMQSRDFTFVGSVVGVLSAAARRRVTHGRPVNLAFGTRHTLLDLLDLLEKVLGAPVARHHVDARPGDVRHSQADQAALRRLFPEAEAVSLEEGLQETVSWFRRQDPQGFLPAERPEPIRG